MNAQTPIAAAHHWFATHAAQYLDRDANAMVNVCAAHLCETLALSEATAKLTAHQVHADRTHSNASIPLFIDVDRSTSTLLALRDTAQGVHHVVTMPELVALLHARNAG